jgi:hypothetical protein
MFPSSIAHTGRAESSSTRRSGFCFVQPALGELQLFFGARGCCSRSGEARKRRGQAQRSRHRRGLAVLVGHAQSARLKERCSQRRIRLRLDRDAPVKLAEVQHLRWQWGARARLHAPPDQRESRALPGDRHVVPGGRSRELDALRLQQTLHQRFALLIATAAQPVRSCELQEG